MVTSEWYIRVFSSSGIQRGVVSLPGPVLCAAGNNNHLLIVYHRAAGM